MSVRARIAAIQRLEPGEVVGYGMRYTASSRRRIAVLPIGYGDGFPRVRNQGGALIHGKHAPLIGGIAMDALMVDITEIPETQMWDEAVIMGRQGSQEITVHDLAKFKPTSENRRILRKGEGIEVKLVPRDKYDYTPERRQFFKTYADIRFGKDIMTFERLDALFASPIISHLLVFIDAKTGVEVG